MNMTTAQKELFTDVVIKCSPTTRHRIAEVIREYDKKIDDAKTELEQERVISSGLESALKDFEKLMDDIYDMTVQGEIRKMIEEFKDEHNG